ncbi:unnamed protein product [Schistocephalus solidus]|uniref:Uncharacterized protein n=1 Tax=Schistocephalus solidus TaxID=70667 RepID=A0A0X3Q5B4_SCHSO|nr:unnamed protein product [Schistocephalus solidus]
MTTPTQLATPLPACSGGLIEYASYVGNANHSWAEAFGPCTLQEPSTWFLLVILLTVLLLTLTLLLSSCCSAVKNGASSASASTTPHGQLFEMEEAEEGAGSEPSDQIELTDLEKLQQQQQQQAVQLVVVTATQQPPTKFSEKLLALLRHPFFAVIRVESKGLFAFLRLTRANSARGDFPSLLGNADESQSLHCETASSAAVEEQASVSSGGPSTSLLNPDDVNTIRMTSSHEFCCSSLNSGYILFFLLLGLVLLLSGTIFTCVASYRLSSTLTALPIHVGSVAQATKLLSNRWISQCYSIAIRVIEADVQPNRPTNNSQLRPFIEQMKSIFGRQIIELYKLAKNNSASINVEEETGKQIRAFDILLRRLAALFSVAPKLSNDYVNAALDGYYMYTRELVRLSPHPLFLSTFAPEARSSDDIWRMNTVLNITGVILCQYGVDGGPFRSCTEVKRHLSQIAIAVNALPHRMAKEDLSQVIAYMRVPQLLGAETYVQKWLPVARDPPAAIPLLFNELVVPEIDKARASLNRSLDNLPATFSNATSPYIAISAGLIGFLTGLLVFFSAGLLLVLALSLTPLRTYRPGEGGGCGGGWWTQNTKTCQNATLLGLGLCAAVVCCLFGLGLAYAGAVGEVEACAYLLEKPKQLLADQWLLKLLRQQLLTGVKPLREVSQIDQIDLRLPYPLLTTLDSQYMAASSPPLFQALGMNRPVNLSALLFSPWLNRTLYDLWFRDVRPLMQREKLSTKIPRIQLDTVFAEVQKTLRLKQTFDDLHVGNTSNYLPIPTVDYYSQLVVALNGVVSNKRVPSMVRVEASNLSGIYSLVGHLVLRYRKQFAKVDAALKTVQENKRILVVLRPMIQVADAILSFLANKTDTQLVDLFSNATASIWNDSRIQVANHLIPVGHRLLDLLLPYPGLQTTYRLTLGPFCATSASLAASASQHPFPLLRTLREFGLGLCLSAILIIIFSIWHFRRR